MALRSTLRAGCRGPNGRSPDRANLRSSSAPGSRRPASGPCPAIPRSRGCSTPHGADARPRAGAGRDPGSPRSKPRPRPPVNTLSATDPPHPVPGLRVSRTFDTAGEFRSGLEENRQEGSAPRIRRLPRRCPKRRLTRNGNSPPVSLSVKLASDGRIRRRSPQPVVGRGRFSPQVILLANSLAWGRDAVAAVGVGCTRGRSGFAGTPSAPSARPILNSPAVSALRESQEVMTRCAL